MTLKVFKEQEFRTAARKMISQANEIMREYEIAGYRMTMRQLYYQFVSRGLFENKVANYKKLINNLTNGRLAGLVSWDILTDNEREKKGWLIEEDTHEIASRLPHHFAVDMWASQERYVEVWVEKKALENVVERACRRYRVPFMACKGYLSTSTGYEAGKRFAMQADRFNAPPLILHLGDHDPSGIDMTRDNDERACMFSETCVEVKRIALNMDQIEQYTPPPNPAKMTDTRADDYVRMYGDESWELDALEPQVIETLITDEFDQIIDREKWESELDREQESKDLLRRIADNWSEVEEYARDNF